MNDQISELNQALGARDHEISQLKQKLQDAELLRPAAESYLRLKRHRNELGEWLADQAGDAFRPTIDAALGGEDFIPCLFFQFANGKQHRFELVETKYRVSDDD
jgi:hypothetical protein